MASEAAVNTGKSGKKNASDYATIEIVDDVAVIRLDTPGKSVNTLSKKMLQWFQHNLPELERNKDVKALVIASGKKDTFVAGADIDMLKEFTSRDEILTLLREVHTFQRRTERGKMPTVAAIHGEALGGGLELALACNYIVASNHPKTKLGQPEVQLGLLPGAGGTQRLPLRVGLEHALKMILQGSPIDAKRALKMGLIDELVHPNDLITVAVRAALKLARGAAPSREAGKKRGRGLRGFLIERTPLKGQAFERARKGVLERTRGKYPAPLRAIEVIEETYGGPIDRGLEIEAEAFADLVVSPEAKALMGIFFMKNTVDKRELPAEPLTVHKVGVLGAGLMGAGIGQVLSSRGYTVRLKDIKNEAVAAGLKYAWDIYNKRVKRRRMREVERDVAMSHISGGTTYAGFGRAEVVIEAVFEDLNIKRKVLEETEAETSDDCIFASNTSSLPITQIAEVSKRKDRVIGMHFFSPVHRMPLCEVIRTKDTAKEVEATIVQLGRRMGKTVIVVNDGTGFFTSRVLAPFMNEAAWCLADGAKIEEIDTALMDFGFPVGPMTLIDEVGIDVGQKVGKIMLEAFGSRLKPPTTMEKIAADDRKGRKNGKGIYLYEGPGGEKGDPDPSVYDLIDWKRKEISPTEIADRCWLQMLNETALCIEDGIIEDPVDIDIAVIFGFGFPPFRGGILRTADIWGLQKVVDRMARLQERYGDRFQPAKLLSDMAKANKKFHT